MTRKHTRDAIAEAFTALLWERNIDQITVSMITDKAGCSRKTFYYYYKDVYDLACDICDRKIHIYLKPGGDGYREGFRSLLNWLNEERQVILNMCHGYGKDALDRFMSQASEHYARERVFGSPDADNLREGDLKALVRMYTYMLYGMFADWIKNGMTGDYERVLDVSLESLELLINRLKK